MKNIHILPTDKPSRTYKIDSIGKLDWSEGYLHQVDGATNQNICITSDEEIKEGEYGLSKLNEIIKFHSGYDYKYYAKIILTTDQDLIKDGVQAIDDEFLEWFVKNPSCEEVRVQLEVGSLRWSHSKNTFKIIIPKEEPKQVELLGGIEKGKRYVIVGKPKQETLEEVELAIMFHNTYERLAPSFGYETRVDTKLFETTTSNGMLMIAVCKEIIKWQQERSYSEEDMAESFMACWKANVPEGFECKLSFNEWFEQFKKK